VAPEALPISFEPCRDYLPGVLDIADFGGNGFRKTGHVPATGDVVTAFV
jgi:hypothetical protein